MPETEVPSLIEQVIVITAGIFLFCLLWTALLWRHIYRLYLRWSVYHRFHSFNREDLFLAKHQPFYAALSLKNRKRFLLRLLTLKMYSKFINRTKKPIHSGHKLLVLSSKVQLTFGLDRFSFPHFYRYAIYGGLYSGDFNGKSAQFKGHVTRRGWTVLSFPHLLSGFENPDDGVNLGLHEAAHAFELEMQVQPKSFGNNTFQEYRKLIGELQSHWKEWGQTWPPTLRKTYSPVRSELFPVLTEHFFETPEQLSIDHPRLYDALAKTYNQNPLQPLLG